MKTFILISTLAFASADLVDNYLRDLMTESTSRSFEKDPTTGKFRCEPGFTGSDCSMLKCPFSMSFTTSDIGKDWLYTPSTAALKIKMYTGSGAKETVTGKQAQCTKDTTFDNQHVYRECGGRGLCDRSTGECKCFASFTGEGCRRTTCPNDCSGHGQCRTEANSFYFIGQTPKTPYGNQIPAYSKAAGTPTWGIHWPWLKYQQCVCDAGYEGDDCSLRVCPKGDDPETECANDLGVDVQNLACTFAKSGGSDLTAAFFQLRFTDQFGAEFDTRPIMIDVTNMSPAENANSIQDALEALPNFAIPEIEVDFDDGTKATPAIKISFTDGHNTGKQSMLRVMSAATCASGSQPLFRSVVAGGDLTCVVSRTALVNNDYKESATCSDRGICDQSTGRCNCFDGYFGLACDNVNTYI